MCPKPHRRLVRPATILAWSVVLSTVPACSQPGPKPPPGGLPPQPAAADATTSTPLAASVFLSQLQLLPGQIESAMAALNLAAVSTGVDRAETIQTFNSNLSTVQSSIAAVVGEIDELEQLGQTQYFANWPRTRFGEAVAAGATIPPEAYDPVAFEMKQLGPKARAFLRNLNLAADELARSPGANTPKLNELLVALNQGTPGMLESVRSVSVAADRASGEGPASSG